jgi:hypothetical protein
VQICFPPHVQQQVRAITVDGSTLYRDPHFSMRGKMYSLGYPPRNNIVMTPINWLHLCAAASGQTGTREHHSSNSLLSTYKFL